MRVMFLVGMPGSGKSTLAKLIVKAMKVEQPKWYCHYVEMSSIVKEWLKTSTAKDLLYTDLGSEQLQKLLYGKIRGDFCVVSGVREQWLIDEWDYAAKVVVSLQVDDVLRKHRYLELGKTAKYWEEADIRAVQMKVPEMVQAADVVIAKQCQDPEKTAEDIIRTVFTYDYKTFIKEVI